MLPYRSLRHLRRARRVGGILIKYGLGQVVSHLRLGRFFLVPRWGLLGREGRLTSPERVRMALQEIGPTAIKLGQVLSSRADAIPEEYVVELRKLQDSAPGVAFEQVKALVEQELKGAIASVFESFDAEPVASASLGQVHYATLAGGQQVVVKAQRGDARETVEADLAILSDIAVMLDTRFPALRRYDLPGLAREFGAVMHDELMYKVEAHNAEQMADLLEDEHGIRVPRPRWEHTTERVLTLERLDGIRIDRVEEIERAGHDRKALARTLAASALEQVFVHGLFHADPHQGNLRVMADGRIALLDWGMVGRLDERLRRQLAQVFSALFSRDAEGMVEQLVQMGAIGENADMRALSADLGRLLSRYYFLPRKQFPMGELLSRAVGLMFHHDVRLPAEFPLLAKVVLVTEGICRSLDADFDYNDAAKPLIERLRAEYLSPARLVREALDAARRLHRQLTALPGRLGRVLADMERGALRVRVAEEEAGRRSARTLALANRVCAAVVLSAVMIGSIICMLSPAVPVALKWWIGVPALGVTCLALVMFGMGALRAR